MDFALTAQQEEMRKTVREFAESELKPIAAEVDKKAEFPYATMKKIADRGWMGLPFPPEYGGRGVDYISYIIAVEELSRACASHGVIVQTHCALCCWPIFTYGTEEQKRKYLPDLLSGRKLGAFGLTEPSAGTDASGIKTKAADMGDYWLLNGSKIFISSGGIADVYVILAMTDKSQGTRGISAFILEKGMEGFRVPMHEEKMGIRGSVAAELVFEDCRVPKENQLGELGQGFKIAMSSLDIGRLGIAAQALGIAQGAFDETLDYVKNTTEESPEGFDWAELGYEFKPGRALCKTQAVSFEMANMFNRIEMSRLLLYRACDLTTKNGRASVEAAQAKLACSETAMYVTNKAVQFLGLNGYSTAYPVERMMRDAKITEIYEGTSEAMKMVISGKIFK